MSINKRDGLCSIGVFYDGNYFLHISNYYNYVHARKARLSIAGLHQFIIDKVSVIEGRDSSLCRITDAHYFRSRLNARAASKRANQLFYDRAFDDILTNMGIITHYLPVRQLSEKRDERDLSVWLAMEAYEQSLLKQFDVFVLISANGDYQPLVRKINTLGTKVLLLSWDFEFENDEGERVVTKTSQDLLGEVSFHIPMFDASDHPPEGEEEVYESLFMKVNQAIPVENGEEGRFRSEVMSLKSGYGFIRYPNNNLFFHHSDVLNIDFEELYEGDKVEFRVDKNERGEDVAKDVLLLDED